MNATILANKPYKDSYFFKNWKKTSDEKISPTKTLKIKSPDNFNN